eukprot:TRINITY_DN595_c0_g1_i1.p1 TRINITY_DN595_c0_g1~~TRINITY_DN595_c0_g1_i1.p1  ORF type:complete len:878 (-),score=165.01 TRINITY_DN595_c0_g1_i1:1036-3669(-)
MDSGPTRTAVVMEFASSPLGPGKCEGQDQFPIGMRVLVVDDDPLCLLILDRMLRRCNYQVKTCQRARQALDMLRDENNKFDIVLSDVMMPDMDGFKLLELVGLEMDLPVIMMSANGETSAVMKGITHGACDYLLKPVRIEELKNIWQHVVRKKRSELKAGMSGSVEENNKKAQEESEYTSSANETGSDWAMKVPKRRKESKTDTFEEDDDGDDGDPNTLKKPRVVWSVELHQQFVNAVNQLGIEKAVPKRILEIMNVQGLTRENVASHLQKYRLYLKRLSGVSDGQGPSMSNSSMEFNAAPLVGGAQKFPVDLLTELNVAVASGKFATLQSLQTDNSGRLGGLNPLLLQLANMQQHNGGGVQPLPQMSHALPQSRLLPPSLLSSPGPGLQALGQPSLDVSQLSQSQQQIALLSQGRLNVSSATLTGDSLSNLSLLQHLGTLSSSPNLPNGLGSTTASLLASDLSSSLGLPGGNSGLSLGNGTLSMGLGPQGKPGISGAGSLGGMNSMSMGHGSDGALQSKYQVHLMNQQLLQQSGQQGALCANAKGLPTLSPRLSATDSVGAGGGDTTLGSGNNGATLPMSASLLEVFGSNGPGSMSNLRAAARTLSGQMASSGGAGMDSLPRKLPQSSALSDPQTQTLPQQSAGMSEVSSRNVCPRQMSSKEIASLGGLAGVSLSQVSQSLGSMGQGGSACATRPKAGGSPGFGSAPMLSEITSSIRGLGDCRPMSDCQQPLPTLGGGFGDLNSMYSWGGAGLSTSSVNSQGSIPSVSGKSMYKAQDRDARGSLGLCTGEGAPKISSQGMNSLGMSGPSLVATTSVKGELYGKDVDPKVEGMTGLAMAPSEDFLNLFFYKAPDVLPSLELDDQNFNMDAKGGVRWC